MGIRACFFLSCKVMTNSLYCDGLRTERTVTTDLAWNCWKSINISTGAIHWWKWECKSVLGIWTQENQIYILCIQDIDAILTHSCHVEMSHNYTTVLRPRYKWRRSRYWCWLMSIELWENEWVSWRDLFNSENTRLLSNETGQGF